MSSEWSQPMCDDCWTSRRPTREPYRMQIPDREVCAWCGTETRSGIYVRVDPATVPHPTGGDDA